MIGQIDLFGPEPPRAPAGPIMNPYERGRALLGKRVRFIRNKLNTYTVRHVRAMGDVEFTEQPGKFWPPDILEVTP